MANRSHGTSFTKCNDLEFAHTILTAREQHPELYDENGRCLMCKRLGLLSEQQKVKSE